MSPDSTRRNVSFGFVILGQAVIAGGLIAMLVITTQGVSEIPDPPTKRLLLRLAWLSLLLLSLTLLMILWSAIRHIRYRLWHSAPLKPSNYINAWELAGKRFKLEEEDDADADADDEAAPDGPA